MAKQRYINTKMWEDAWFNDLDPIEKLFFIYFLTNPMTNIIGVYELSKGTMGRATGLESRVVNEILKRFEEAGKVFYQDGWVIIKNFIKHQNYKSPKIKLGIEAEMENIPNNIKNFMKGGYGMDTLSHSNTNIIKYNTNINESAIAELYTLFKEKINNNVKLLTKAKDKVKLRLGTFTLEELKQAIINFSADTWCMQNNAHRGIAWFFHSDERIENYLNLKPEQSAGFIDLTKHGKN